MKKIVKAISALLLIAIIGLIAIVTVIGLLGWQQYKQVTQQQPLADIVEQIQSRDDYVQLKDVSEDFLDALVAIEDHRFWTHSGFDMLTTTRVLFENILSMSLSQGGSTITQQLARNFYFTQEKKFTRKVAELMVAQDLEENYSKEDILELYVNIIYFGNDLNGIGQASAFYFDKTPAELDLNESSWLAGLPQAPSVYSVDKEKGRQRQKQVAAAMAQYHYITTEQAAGVTLP